MTPDPLDKIRDQLLAGIGKEPARRQRRRVGFAAAVVAAILGVAGLALAVPSRDDANDAVVAGEDTGDGTTGPEFVPPLGERPGGAIWSIEQPPRWDRAGPELMPSLGSDSLTLASFDLRAGGERCAQVPENAIRDIGADDALVSVWFGGAASDELPAWPEDGFPAADVLQMGGHDSLACSERDELEVHWGTLEHTGIGIEVLVALGPDVPADVEATAWEALSSLRPRDDVESAETPECVVTVPADGQRAMPTTSGDGTPIDGHGWYGTPDLWTSLPIDGRHARRKSFWFSEHFPGGANEPRPDIAVTWRRLDAPAEPITAGSPGTNAHSGDVGWAMLAGIDPPELGCWEVTATYRGYELSYVYWHPPVTVPDVVGLEVAAAKAELNRANLVGRVNDFDAPFDFALVIAQEPPSDVEVPSGVPVGFRTTLPDPPEQQECPGTAHPRDPASADALPNVESVTRRTAAEAWASLPGREVDGTPTYLGRWDRQAWQRNDAGEIEIVSIDGYQLVVVHERADDCPDGPPSSTNGVPITHWILPDDAGE